MFRKLIASKKLRQRVAFIIFIFLVAPFAIYGVSSRRLSKPAGIIFGKAISAENFQSERAWVMRQLRSQFGEASDSLNQLGAFVDQTVWDRLMLVQEAKRERIHVSDSELAKLIRDIPGLQDNGRFDTERYRRFMVAIGTSPQEFERHIRQDLAIERLVNKVKASVAITDEEVRAAYDKANEQLTASVIFFDPKTFMQEASGGITEEALRAAYDAHPEYYRTKEKITFDYAGAGQENVAAKTEIDEKALEAFYQDHLDDWPKNDDKKPKPLAEIRETVRQQAMDEDKRKRLTNLALDIQDDLDAKKPFDEIVSSRQLTVKNIGPINPGDVWANGEPEPAILQAAAQLQEGETSNLVKTDNGIAIIRLTKRIASYVPPFEEVREQVRERLVNEHARGLAKTKAAAVYEQLKSKLSSGAGYEESLKSIGGAASPSSWTFTRTGAIGPLGAEPKANQTAFETADGSITDVIETATGFAILRPEKRIAADPAKFAEAEAKTREETISKRQSDQTTDWLVGVRSRAKLKIFAPDNSPDA